MAVAAFLRHDRVPGYALDLAALFPSLKIKNADAVAREDGDFAIAESRRLIELGEPNGYWQLAQSYAKFGEKPKAEQIMNGLIERSKELRRGSIAIAFVYGALGDTDQTLAWLDSAYQEHEPWLVLLDAYPAFDAVRADPRFQDLVRRIGIPVG